MKSPLPVCVAIAGLLNACGSSDSKTLPSAAAPDTKTSTTVPKIGVINLSTVPELDTFLQSQSQTALNLASGTPPKFTAIADSMATYLTGDLTALAAAIEADRSAHRWLAMKAKLSTFMEAESKCSVLEASARIIQRLKEDTAQLCLIKAATALGDKVMKYESGEAIADLAKALEAGTSAKVLQMGMKDKGQPHFDIIEIAAAATDTNTYHARYTTCLTSSNKAFRQNTLDIDLTTGAVTFNSLKNGAIDDAGVKPNAAFTMSGFLLADSAGVLSADTAKTRTVDYASAGTMGSFTSTNQGSLKLTGDDLAASFFVADTGSDKDGRSLARTNKTALSIQFSGTKTADLTFSQGAGRSLLTINGTNANGATISNTVDRSIAFAYSDTAEPRYETVTSSAYADTVAAVDFSSDGILKQSTPTAPDMSAIDSTPCTATPTTVIGYTARPEDNTDLAQALAACNAFPAEKSGNMCDVLRDLEHDVNRAMNDRKDATGDATK